jgi:hypothetical protein
MMLAIHIANRDNPSLKKRYFNFSLPFFFFLWFFVAPQILRSFKQACIKIAYLQAIIREFYGMRFKATEEPTLVPYDLLVSLALGRLVMQDVCNVY